jgi:hypothetical protein
MVGARRNVAGGAGRVSGAAQGDWLTPATNGDTVAFCNHIPTEVVDP